MWHLATVADALTHDFYVGAARFDQTRSEVVSTRTGPTGAPSTPGRVRRGTRSALRAVRGALRR